MKKHTKSLSRNPYIRIFIIGIFEVIGLIVMAILLDGITIARFGTAIAAVAFIGLINALFWPIVSKVLLPFAILTGGLLFLVLNGAVIMLVSRFIDGFTVNSLWTATITSFGITAINVILSTLFTIDDDGSYYRNVVAKRMKKQGKVEETDKPGVFFLEIDGLAEPVLRKAMDLGYTPTMKRWLEDGSHNLVGWETDLSSQTGASQAGLLHGNNFDMPAFRWYDRKRKILVSSSNPDDVSYLEKKHANGKGLLVNNGASRGNLMSGDAPNVMNTASVIKDLSRFHSADFYAYFSNPYNFSRTLLLFAWDIVLERYRFWQQRKNDVLPRLNKHHRNFKYALVRGVTTTILRDLNVYTLIGDMFAGVPSAYATFVGYDEVAHHSGVETMDAYDALRKIDQQFTRIENAAKNAPRPYHFVILSDHGQSSGQTFKQRYGKTLEDLVQELAKDKLVQKVDPAGESASNVNVFLSDATRQLKGKGVKKAVSTIKHHTVDDKITKENKSEKAIESKSKGKKKKDELPRIVVLASGNLGLVYGTQRDKRVTLEEMDEVLPGMLEGLVAHEGVGFVMVHSTKHGPVIIGDKGRNYLIEKRVDGKNPLIGFGPRATEHLIREDTFPNCPDILVNSFYNPRKNEVAAFEELIGCHGGMGGYQTKPFILHPTELPLKDKKPLVGAAAVHHLMKVWVKDTDVTTVKS